MSAAAARAVEDVSGLEGSWVLLNETPDFGADLVGQMGLLYLKGEVCP